MDLNYKKTKVILGITKFFLYINQMKLIKTVNSYHNDAIKIKKSKLVNIFGVALDNTVEAFHISKKKNFRDNVAP